MEWPGCIVAHQSARLSPARQWPDWDFGPHSSAVQPLSTTQIAKDAFRKRFVSEVRSRAAKAKDTHFSRQIRMTMSMSVHDYASLHENDHPLVSTRSYKMAAISLLLLL